ncbi:hypothetical protein DRN74_03750 [Candidatus Micrarchaeota archaeon]|nr:MAG: hypothetical protein DRN74_03750 [Candidatus Micrarchaeota archaeon]
MYKLSDVYGKRIFDQHSNFIGTARDVLIDPAEKRIKFLLKEDPMSILGRDRVEAKKFIKENFIPFEKVIAIGDIIILKE